MTRRFQAIRAIRPRHTLWIAAALVIACEEQPSSPVGVDAPGFTVVNSIDPTAVLTVGVDAPANLTLKGTVAGVVVTVDRAVVDLSHATVDCAGQATPDDPRIGVWIQGNRSHVVVRGGGTGLITHCGIGVLIGSVTPVGGALGGSSNRVTGLHIEHVNCPSGPFTIAERLCDVAVAVANSHDNLVDSNRIAAVSEGGILLYGANHAAGTSGGNTVSSNIMIGGFNSYGVLVASNGNVVRGNISDDPYEGFILDGSGNQVIDNQVFNTEQGIYRGIHLLPNADDNTLTRNAIRSTDVGIGVEAGAVRNLIKQNTSTANGQWDALDGNGNCTANSWVMNDFTRADPRCIVGVTIEDVTLTPPASAQLDAAAGAQFTATVTNLGDRLTNIALRTWITQGLFTKRAAGVFPIVCLGPPGVLPKGTCVVRGDSVIANRGAAGTGTLAAGPAQALVELVQVTGGDSIVVDSRAAPIMLTPPAAGSFWEIRPPMPTQRGGMGVGGINGLLYAVGGVTVAYNNGFTQTFRANVEVYDPVDNSWSSRTPLPAPRAYLGVGVVNNVLYAVGGYDGNNPTGLVQAYDPGTNTWTTKAPMPTPRSGLAVAVVNGILYAMGGVDFGGNMVATVEAYDPSTNTWTTKAPMLAARRIHAAGVVNGIIYVTGGDPGGTVEAYDPTVGTWTTRASMPAPRGGLAAGVVSGLLYTVGSEFPETSEAVYDPTADVWTSLPPMPTPRVVPSAAGIDGLLYTVGGQVAIGGLPSSLGVLEVYHP
jgi:Kelch motif protein/copper-binding protein NosD